MTDGPPPSSYRRARATASGLERFASHRGIPTRPELVFDRDVIEAFVREGSPSWSPATRGTYRTTLYRRADDFGPGGPRGAPFAGSPAPAPYTGAELAGLWAMARGATSDWRRRSASVMLAAGAGAGLRPAELVALGGSDVVVEGPRTIVAVSGTRPRRVPVVDRYAAGLLEAAGAAGPGPLFRPGAASRRDKNFVNDFARKLRSDPDDPWWSMGRLRSTFICGHLRVATPLSELMAATGIVEVESIARYARHLDGASSKASLRRRLREEQGR